MSDNQPLHNTDLEIVHVEIEPLSDEALEEVAGGVADNPADSCYACCSCSACSG
jgi:hypothetical protein